MPTDYPVSALLSDIMDVVQEAAVYVVPAAILLGVINYVVGWFMHVIMSLPKVSFRD